jgi:hypothetical protein
MADFPSELILALDVLGQSEVFCAGLEPVSGQTCPGLEPVSGHPCPGLEPESGQTFGFVEETFQQAEVDTVQVSGHFCWIDFTSSFQSG